MGKHYKGSNNKTLFFPKVEDRLKIRINTAPKFTTITMGHGNIKSYLYEGKIGENPSVSVKKVTKPCNT